MDNFEFPFRDYKLNKFICLNTFKDALFTFLYIILSRFLSISFFILLSSLIFFLYMSLIFSYLKYSLIAFFFTNLINTIFYTFFNFDIFDFHLVFLYFRFIIYIFNIIKFMIIFTAQVCYLVIIPVKMNKIIINISFYFSLYLK